MRAFLRDAAERVWSTGVSLLLCAVLFFQLSAMASEPAAAFEFAAVQGATLGDVALAASEWFGVSVVLPPEAASVGVAGRVSGLDLEGVLAVIEHWSGLAPRRIGDAVFFGGKSRERLQGIESYGLRREQLGELFGARSSVIGDRVLFKGNARDLQEAAEVLEPLASRPSMLLEVYSVSSSSNQIDRVNAWLERFKIGAEYVAGVPDVTGFEGLRDVADVAVFLRLLDEGAFGRVEIRELVRLLSGSESTFESGTVVETPLIIREPETGVDLVSRVERRTVGLNLTLRGVVVGERWLLDVTLDDGSFVNEREVKTVFTGEQIVDPGTSWFLLGSYTRRILTEQRRGVPLLRSVPWIGPAFRKRETTEDLQEVMLLARVLSESPVLPAAAAAIMRTSANVVYRGSKSESGGAVGGSSGGGRGVEVEGEKKSQKKG